MNNSEDEKKEEKCNEDKNDQDKCSEDKYNDISEYVNDPEQNIDMTVINKNIEKERKKKEAQKKSINLNYTFFDYEDIDEELEDDREFTSYINSKDLELEDQIVDLKDED